ncbi:MAG: FkbM family methyltransferase [Calothrix sp. MO_167.B42]|nr:FkbM family methyltransferase [Calothrix sp. MO_167.B42]
MKAKEYVAHKLIGTPLETWARGLRDITQLPQRIKYPELHNIYIESARTKLAMSRIIHNSMNCIDVGAHLGSVLNLINRFSPDGKHIAIEPIPYKYNWLKHKFPHVEILSMAVSDTQGEANFYIPRRSSFSGLSLRSYTKETEQDIQILKVKVNKLDDIVPHDLAIGFIKIDVEGAELLTLKGSESILRRYHPTILFECAQDSLESHNISPWDIYEFFRTHDYSLFLIQDWLSSGEALSYERFLSSMEYPFQAFNFLAIPQ